MNKWFKNQDTGYWTRTNIILLAIAFEHLIIGVKQVIQTLIPDVPKSVRKAESKRLKCEEQARKKVETAINDRKKEAKKNGFEVNDKG